MNSNYTSVHASDIDWIESMFHKFINHETLDASWLSFFEGFQLGCESQSATSSNHEQYYDALQEKKAQLLLMVYRLYGYLQSDISPIEPTEESKLIQEKLRSFKLDETIPSLGLLPNQYVTVREFISFLKKCYCRSIAVETLTCSPDIQEFIWKLMEEKRDSLPSEKLLQVYTDLAQATLFEEFLQIKFTGQKRFSLEGCESLIAMLNHLVEYGAIHNNVDRYVFGMAHRGRLNVLTNVLDKPPHQIFMEFEDKPIEYNINHEGDVKYHKGFQTTKQIQERLVALELLPNPSHLEAVNPVVEGFVAAIQHQGSPEKELSSLAVLLHGDAAFSGQGIVYETLQLSQIQGYSTHGSIHIVINNYIGFTALPRESRSTPYCTDISKMLGIPVFRVNSEDIEACLQVIEYAVIVRSRFQCDVIIDLCCYRKHGHNESDDPSVTNPLLYKKIQEKLPIFRQFEQKLISNPDYDITVSNIQRIQEQVQERFQQELALIQQDEYVPEQRSCVDCERLIKNELLFNNIDVSLPEDILLAIIEKLNYIPEHFTPHSKVQTLIKKRIRMQHGEAGIDWGLAEEIAFASLLLEKYSLRLSGQDSIRGTFSQRHLLWTDVNTGDTYSPLYLLSSDQGSVSMYNSPLSEYGVLGFEYGYACKAEKALVLWEAQFGDFSNGAQIIFDQYISSAIQKWDLHSHLVMLLPHGYEGQGPEHSSARIERYVQLAADWNFQVVLPSTPVQYFRILREHVKREISLPLVIFTPKLLLRHPRCVNSITDFTLSSGFQPILEDEQPNYDAHILVLCSGKIYYDYLTYLSEENKRFYACLRIESLYPLHLEFLASLLSKYSQVHTFVWLQEEPINMGAYEYFFMATQNIFHKKLHCVTRPRSSSSATGSAQLSQKELSSLMNTLFSLAR